MSCSPALALRLPSSDRLPSQPAESRFDVSDARDDALDVALIVSRQSITMEAKQRVWRKGLLPGARSLEPLLAGHLSCWLLAHNKRLHCHLIDRRSFSQTNPLPPRPRSVDGSSRVTPALHRPHREQWRLEVGGLEVPPTLPPPPSRPPSLSSRPELTSVCPACLQSFNSSVCSLKHRKILADQPVQHASHACGCRSRHGFQWKHLGDSRLFRRAGARQHGPRSSWGSCRWAAAD